MRIYQDTSLSDLLLAAQDNLRDVAPGEVVTVRDLFRGFEWKRLKPPVPSQLGTLFFAYAKAEGKEIVEVGPKNKQNQQQYIKK